MPILNYKGEDGQFHSLGGLLKGDPGNAGVVVGNTKPTDPSVKVWINSAGDPMTAEQIPVSSTDNSSVATALGNKVPNSRTINGKPLNSDVVLSASDLEGAAADSNKLGGKDPKYYIQPRNLLDNSDFRNPVNQRWKTNCNSVGYTIDRWELSYIGSGVSITDGGVTIKKSSSLVVFIQILSEDVRKRLIGKTVTFAAKTSDGEIEVANATVGEVGTALDVYGTNFSGGLMPNIYHDVSMSTLELRILASTTSSDTTFEWAALYEGSYTADTLPPYVPKGYAAELAECQRRFVKRTERIISAANGHACIKLPQTMVDIPTVSVSQGEFSVATLYDLFIINLSANTDYLITYEASRDL